MATTDQSRPTDAPSGSDGGLPVNALFLILFGCFDLIYGVLLIPILNGSLRSDSGATNAMFVIAFAIMIGFLGMTPVGSFGESRLLFIIGLGLVLFGSVAFVSPGTLHRAMSYVLAAMLLALGLIRLPLFLVRLRRDGSAVPASFSVSYVVMHVLCLLIGLQIVFHWPDWLLVPGLVLLGICQLVLGGLAVRLGPAVPEAVPDKPARPPLGRMKMSMRSQLMLLLAVTMVFMAVMVVLAVMRIAPYEGSRASVEFVFITAMQVMLVGSTPIRDFAPSWPLAILGMLMASAAMVASILPGLIDGALGAAIGVSNLLTAGFGLVHLIGAARRARTLPPGPSRRFVWRIVIVSVITYLLVTIFGFNLLVPDVIPGIVMLAVLLLAGCALGWLSTLLDKIPQPGAATPAT